MKLQTQFTVPNKELRDLDYVKKVEVLDDANKPKQHPCALKVHLF